ncbi:phosphatidylinositol 4-kinase beta 1-like isoform X1 [Coffea arabica]|uniref:1-phosphatidylinositol 4-kinase n=1 Tax=Coffea arabica TaxID=13443 RepID=A0A6P6T797_COFAR|nr:phosphatidylinositol 4-kinase beta 1-like isoform X1 [Coffea arabica]
MAKLLGLARGLIGEPAESPREITRTILTSENIGESGWLIRFFDSAFFCEWIAVSYLYKHDHAGVRDYLCNRMYTLPLPGIESYLFQICYMLIYKPSPSLDKFVIDICSKSLQIALKVHWFLMSELEDNDDNDGISRIQEKCQIAATLMGEWPPLIRPQNAASSSPMGKNQMLNRLLSSKQKLLSLTSSPPSTQRSMSLSPTSGNNLQQDDGGGSNQNLNSKVSSPEENKIFKKFIPGPKMRDALLFRKSVDKDEEESEKDGFFKRLLRDSRDEDVRKVAGKDEVEPEKEGFFKRLRRDSSRDDDSRKSLDNDEEPAKKEEGFFKRLLGDNRDEDSRKSMDKSDDESEKDGFFRRFLKDSKDEEEELTSSSDGFFKRIFRDSKNDAEEKAGSKSGDDDGKEGFFRKLFKEKFEEKKDVGERNDDEERTRKNSEDDEKEGFFKKFFKERFEDKKDMNDRSQEDGKGQPNGEEDEHLDFSLFRRIFRVHPEDPKSPAVQENSNGSNFLESSPGTEKFFRKLFRDRDRSVEDSELFGSKKNKEKCPASPKQENEKLIAKPPLPNNAASHFRKGGYHASLDFVQSLCETSFALVDVFPIEDRKSALCESLVEINAHIAAAQSSGGICFPTGKGTYRVVHIPVDEAVLLNSREKAPYLICVEVLKSETASNSKDVSNSQKLSKGGIPLANGDALLPKPPPWAYPLWTGPDMYHSGYDRMSKSTSQAIDEAMTQLWEAKVKFVHVNLSVESQSNSEIHFCRPEITPSSGGQNKEFATHASLLREGLDLEWVKVSLTADPGVSMDDIVDQEPPRRREHRRVPSTVAIEEVKAAALKGEAPPGLPLKGAGQDSSDAKSKTANGGIPKETDALSGELWEVKKERIRKASDYGKLPGWDLRSIVVKSGDDCRQEHLAVQLISHFHDIFQEAGLPLWLRPYEVLVTSSYSALIETLTDTASIHSIKSRYSNISSLRDFFVAKYQENSPSFKLAQRNFVESMAGYSLVCYLLQIKDRHNGNLLLDEEGHIIHIDFGFMLSNSPGGVNFESAPFKLTRELLEVMDSDAEGVSSEFFDYFKVLCIQGFLTCRKHAERIILLVEMVQDSGFPCFKGGPRAIQNLRKRFHLSLTEEQCVSLVLSLISSSLDAWRTRQYDYYQKVLNGIL